MQECNSPGQLAQIDEDLFLFNSFMKYNMKSKQDKHSTNLQIILKLDINTLNLFYNYYVVSTF